MKVHVKEAYIDEWGAFHAIVLPGPGVVGQVNIPADHDFCVWIGIESMEPIPVKQVLEDGNTTAVVPELDDEPDYGPMDADLVIDPDAGGKSFPIMAESDTVPDLELIEDDSPTDPGVVTEFPTPAGHLVTGAHPGPEKRAAAATSVEEGELPDGTENQFRGAIDKYWQENQS